MPRKTLEKEQQRRVARREREARKKMPWLIFLTCEKTDISQEQSQLEGKKCWCNHFHFPLNGQAERFEKVAKDIASHLFVCFEKKIKLSSQEKEFWRFKIRTIKASNPELEIFFNENSRSIIPPQVMGKVIMKSEIHKTIKE
jgi:hypothetical protein